MSPDDFKRLVAAGLSTDQIAIVMEMMDRDQKAFAAAEEERKAKGRERVARWREKRHGDVTETSPKVTDTLAGERARVEDKTSSSEIEPREEKNSAPASPSPRRHLETVLDSEHADAVLEHRKRIKAPLTERSAKLLAKELAKCPDPNLAADTMMLRGWRGFEASWLASPARAGPANSRQSPVDHFRNLASELNGQERNDRGPGSHRDDAAGVPVLTIEHHGR